MSLFGGKDKTKEAAGRALGRGGEGPAAKPGTGGNASSSKNGAGSNTAAEGESKTQERKRSLTDGFRSAARRDADASEDSLRGETVANIGKSIIFKGELTGDEDLEIEGQVEGRIQLPKRCAPLSSFHESLSKRTSKGFGSPESL